MMYVHLYGDQTIAEAPDTLCSLTELVLLLYKSRN
jgi:hypothetical protein